MPDYYPMTLRIGGRITRAQLKRIEELAKSYAAYSRGGGEFDGYDDAKGFEGEEPYLRLYLPNAPWGMAEELEAYLKQQKIPFDRYTGPNYGDDGVMVFYRPELGDEPIERPAVEGEVIVAASDVREVIEKTTGRDDLVEQLKKLIGDDVPPLPPVEIVDEVRTPC